MEKINIRNLYIDLLNKIKKVEGVDKDYVDDLIEVIDLHLSALDQDLSAITNVIPEDASVSNQLVPESGLEPITLDIQTLSSTVSGIGIDVSGIQSVIPPSASSSNKLVPRSDLDLQIENKITISTSDWEQMSGTTNYITTKQLEDNYKSDYTPTVFIDPVYASDQGKCADIRKIKSVNINTDYSPSRITIETNGIPANTMYLVVQGKLA